MNKRAQSPEPKPEEVREGIEEEVETMEELVVEEMEVHETWVEVEERRPTTPEELLEAEGEVVVDAMATIDLLNEEDECWDVVGEGAPVWPPAGHVLEEPFRRISISSGDGHHR